MPNPKLDILVNLLQGLQPDPATTILPLNDADQTLDYCRLIGGKIILNTQNISQIISSLNTVYANYNSLNTRVSSLESNGLSIPYVDIDPLTNGSVRMDLALYNLAEDYKNLKAVLVNNFNSEELSDAVLFENILYEPAELKNQTMLFDPNDENKLMSQYADWVSPSRKLSDTIKNMWITILDIRKAVKPYIDSMPNVNCTTDIVINFTPFVNRENKSVTINFIGSTIPVGYRDVDNNGALITISDGTNSFNSYVNITEANKNTAGVTFYLNNTSLNFISSTITITLKNIQFTNGVTVCNKPNVDKSVIATIDPICPVSAFNTPSTTSISYTFTPRPGVNGTYTIYNGSTVVARYMNPNSTVFGIISSLSPGVYTLKLTITTINNIEYECNTQTITTS